MPRTPPNRGRRGLFALLLIATTTTIGWFVGNWYGRSHYEGCGVESICFGPDWDAFFTGLFLAVASFVISVGVLIAVALLRRRSRRRRAPQTIGIAELSR